MHEGVICACPVLPPHHTRQERRRARRRNKNPQQLLLLLLASAVCSRQHEENLCPQKPTRQGRPPCHGARRTRPSRSCRTERHPHTTSAHDNRRPAHLAKAHMHMHRSSERPPPKLQAAAAGVVESTSQSTASHGGDRTVALLTLCRPPCRPPTTSLFSCGLLESNGGAPPAGNAVAICQELGDLPPHDALLLAYRTPWQGPHHTSQQHIHIHKPHRLLACQQDPHAPSSCAAHQGPRLLASCLPQDTTVPGETAAETPTPLCKPTGLDRQFVK